MTIDHRPTCAICGAPMNNRFIAGRLSQWTWAHARGHRPADGHKAVPRAEDRP
ncbi:hypothetical protein [Frankia sp. Cas3]|uniref:hypothetical protein n=1 Tax=Frankia sp. Cas3 TaxID=3073926 RepID=UPI002AD2CD08|nr:hypothetical protein [Frankia sp. Cas3]